MVVRFGGVMVGRELVGSVGLELEVEVNGGRLEHHL